MAGRVVAGEWDDRKLPENPPQQRSISTACDGCRVGDGRRDGSDCSPFQIRSLRPAQQSSVIRGQQDVGRRVAGGLIV